MGRAVGTGRAEPEGPWGSRIPSDGCVLGLNSAGMERATGALAVVARKCLWAGGRKSYGCLVPRSNEFLHRLLLPPVCLVGTVQPCCPPWCGVSPVPEKHHIKPVAAHLIQRASELLINFSV